MLISRSIHGARHEDKARILRSLNERRALARGRIAVVSFNPPPLWLKEIKTAVITLPSLSIAKIIFKHTV